MPFNIFSLVWLSLALSSFAQRTVTNVTVFSPPSDYLIPRVLYARTVQLEDGSLLATWENYSPEPPKVYFPIYHSTDKGATWKHISNVTDTQNGYDTVFTIVFNCHIKQAFFSSPSFLF